MTRRIDEAMRELSDRLALVPKHREFFAAFAEMHDAAGRLPAMPPLDRLGGDAPMEIAKVLTRFEDQIDDAWRADLIVFGAIMLRMMRGNSEESARG